MKKSRLIILVFLIVLVISAFFASLGYNFFKENDVTNEFYFGVTYGQDSFEDAKILIDKVKGYTNLFIIDSYPITTNYPSPKILNEICDYATESDLHFIVYFFSFLAGDWQQDWVDFAQNRWGTKFLGVYLRDEPGGRQIEEREPVENASSYEDAAKSYVKTISSYFSNQFLNNKNIPMFVSDFALYYYDYLAGFDIVFAEFGWNNSRTREVGLCRGAAEMLDKEWGAIITWTYMQPPYIGNGEEVFQDFMTAYNAGAKYVVLFNYPQHPEDNQYGILTDEHFVAMKQFWEYTLANPSEVQDVSNRVAYIIPNYYGWGMRHLEDKIWGIWNPDEKSSIIWNNLIKLENKYGLLLDIIYDDPSTEGNRKYHQTFDWNS
ncbi:MAG: hypothetical protein P8Y18_09175, partial [Candidatus Bathyarchaeota archaeon]